MALPEQPHPIFASRPDRWHTLQKRAIHPASHYVGMGIALSTPGAFCFTNWGGENMSYPARLVKEASGFTLVELVVTFVIIATLAGAAIPALSVWLPNYRLRRAAMDIFSNLQWAKMQAIRTNRQHAVFFNPAGDGSFEVVNCGADGTYTGGGDDVTVKTVSLLDYDTSH